MARRSRRKRRTRVLVKILKSRFFWILFLLFLTATGVCYLLFLSPVFQVEEIEVSGNDRVRKEKILEKAQSCIEKRLRLGPFPIFSSKSIFLVRPLKMEEVVKRAYPRIGEVGVERSLPDTLVLNVKERRPFAQICTPSGECYTSDEKGVIFEKSASLKRGAEQGVHVFQVEKEELTIILKDEKEFIMGSEVVKPVFLAGAAQARNRIKNSTQMDPVEISLEGDQLRVETDRDVRIYFSLDKEVENQLFNLELVLSEKLSEEKLEDLEYIDLRFGNRIYYK